MAQGFVSLVRRLERAQALQNERFNRAAGGESLALGGGFAHFRGPGHPLNQALGLVDPVTEPALEEAEAFLGAPTVLELSPGADPELWALLGRRGYRLHSFQQLWERRLASFAPRSVAESGREVRAASPGEAPTFNRLVAAAFLERNDWREVVPPFEVSLEVPDAWGFFAFADGEPAGGAMLGVVDGVALLSGDGVLPRFRGRGLQKALIAARLAFAQARGCDVACASTAPGTASHRAYESSGFHAAYPKVEMARG
jgi:GNAT superfamily N-acetyltransferase